MNLVELAEAKIRDSGEYVSIVFEGRDITNLEIGDSLKVGDLQYENLEIQDPLRAMVAGIVSSRLVAKGLREAVVEGELAEEAVAEGSETPVHEEAAPADEAKSGQE